MANDSMTKESQAVQDGCKKWDTPLFTASEMRSVLRLLLEEKEEVGALLGGVYALLPKDDATLQKLVDMAQDKVVDHSDFMWAIEKIHDTTGTDIRC